MKYLYIISNTCANVRYIQKILRQGCPETIDIICENVVPPEVIMDISIQYKKIVFILDSRFVSRSHNRHFLSIHKDCTLGFFENVIIGFLDMDDYPNPDDFEEKELLDLYDINIEFFYPYVLPKCKFYITDRDKHKITVDEDYRIFSLPFKSLDPLHILKDLSDIKDSKVLNFPYPNKPKKQNIL